MFKKRITDRLKLCCLHALINLSSFTIVPSNFTTWSRFLLLTLALRPSVSISCYTWLLMINDCYLIIKLLVLDTIVDAIFRKAPLLSEQSSRFARIRPKVQHPYCRFIDIISNIFHCMSQIYLIKFFHISMAMPVSDLSDFAIPDQDSIIVLWVFFLNQWGSRYLTLC